MEDKEDDAIPNREQSMKFKISSSSKSQVSSDSQSTISDHRTMQRANDYLFEESDSVKEEMKEEDPRNSAIASSVKEQFGPNR